MFSEDKEEEMNKEIEDQTSIDDSPNLNKESDENLSKDDASNTDLSDGVSADELKDSNDNDVELPNEKFDFIIGKKIGMTRVFDDNGKNLPVTIIEAGPCPIVQVKSEDNEGYSALQIGFSKTKKVNKPMQGHFNKAEIKYNTKLVKEFRCDLSQASLIGKEITVNSFEEGEYVNVTGKSKGKGFAGHMKRHNFSGGRASHGKNSVMRKAGSVGAGTWPGRVWKGTRMAGRMGGDNVTVNNLKIIKIDLENNLLFLKGAVPGHSKSIVYIEK